MRIYLPATAAHLRASVLGSSHQPLTAHAATPALAQALPEEDEEGLEVSASLCAADASVVLLADAPGDEATALARAGLEQQQWLYPYPDYKVPSIVLTDAALKHPDFNAFDLLLRNDSEDYNDNRHRVFDEALVNRVLEENGLLGDFSNSFLVVAQRPLPVEKAAGKGKGRNARAASGKAAAAAPWQPAALAWTFAAVHRHRGMATETRFIPQAQGGVRVTKRRILPDEPVSLPLADGHTITLETADSDYFPGRQLAWRALVAHVREGNVPAMVEALRPWCETLLSSAEVGTSPLLAAASGQDLPVAQRVRVRSRRLPGGYPRGRGGVGRRRCHEEHH